MIGITDEKPAHGELHCSRPTADTLLVEVSGDWQLHDDVPSATVLQPYLDAAPGVQRLTFETQALGHWDSSLVTVLLDIFALGAQRQIVVDQAGPARRVATAVAPRHRRAGAPGGAPGGHPSALPRPRRPGDARPDRLGGRHARVHRRSRVRPGGLPARQGPLPPGRVHACSSRSAAPRRCPSSP